MPVLDTVFGKLEVTKRFFSPGVLSLTQTVLKGINSWADFSKKNVLICEYECVSVLAYSADLN